METKLIAGVIGTSALFWWTLTDRLDLPKLWMLLTGLTAILVGRIVAGSRLPIGVGTATVAVAGLVSIVAVGDESLARTEGISLCVVALATTLLAVNGRWEDAAPPLCVTAIGLAVLTWLHPLASLDFLPVCGRVPSTSRPAATLGGPDHLGWMLAGLLPWAGVVLAGPADRAGRWQQLRNLALAIVFGALVLTCCRSAWIMAATSAPLWLGLPRRRNVVTAVVLAAVLVVAAVVVMEVPVGWWFTEVANPNGSGAGRLYIWRVHLSGLQSWTTWLGAGPESFVRSWPALQSQFLSTHPHLEDFRSDLRHAHADAVEILLEFGIIGLACAIVICVRALGIRTASPNRPDPTRASLAALLIGGAVNSVAYFPPTLALMALCIGLRVPLGTTPQTSRAAAAGLALLMAACIVQSTTLLLSEVSRSRATCARLDGDLTAASAAADVAVRLDPRNPRAWLESGLSAESQGQKKNARNAWIRAARDLPTDAVILRIRALENR